MNLIWKFTTFLTVLIAIDAISSDKGPILVHIIFRHGQRTPAEDEIYPNDPYKHETYYPFGFGQLTNKGKSHEYKLGQYLRQRYNTFLGDIYTPDLIDSRSTHFERTVMSLQLVLAGLFPPKGEQIWLDGLNWQPIPYNYQPTNHDEVLLGQNCPSYSRYYNEYKETEEYRNKLGEYSEIFRYIEENSGLTNVSFHEAIKLYCCLETESEWGFVLPEWTTTIYPGILTEAGISFYHLHSATTSLKKLVSGYLLRKIVDDTVAKINGTLIPETRKMFLYSGHDLTIAYFIQTLGLNIGEIPPYGALIMIELHQISGIYGFKIYYENSLQDEPILLNLPNCGQFCPIDAFINLYERYFDDISFCYNSN